MFHGLLPAGMCVRHPATWCGGGFDVRQQPGSMLPKDLFISGFNNGEKNRVKKSLCNTSKSW